MAAPRGYNDVIHGGGACIQWDWKKNKYIFVDKHQLNKELDKLADAHPSSYEAHGRKKRGVSVRRPSYKIQGKKACNPTQFSNSRGKKQLNLSGHKKVAANFRKPLPVWEPRGPQHGDVNAVDGRYKQDDFDLRGISKNPGVRNPPPELMSGHSTFVSIISSRLLHLRAAHTFWRQSPNAFLSYLIKTEDDAITVDVLPLVIQHLKDQTPIALQISMGACLDLLPTIQRLLDSKFEDYVRVGLDMLRVLLRRWWDDLKAENTRSLCQGMLHSRSTPGLYSAFVAMTDEVKLLAKRRGETGKKAQVVADILAKL